MLHCLTAAVGRGGHESAGTRRQHSDPTAAELVVSADSWEAKDSELVVGVVLRLPCRLRLWQPNRQWLPPGFVRSVLLENQGLLQCVDSQLAPYVTAKSGAVKSLNEAVHHPGQYEFGLPQDRVRDFVCLVKLIECQQLPKRCIDESKT